MSLPIMLTVTELAEKTHFKEWFIRKAVNDGWLPCVRSGDSANAPMLFDEEIAGEAIRNRMKPQGKTSKGDVMYLRQSNGM